MHGDAPRPVGRDEVLRTVSLVALGATAALALATRTRAVRRVDAEIERAVGRRRPRLVRAARIGTLPGENYMHPTMGALVTLVILRRRGGVRRRIVVPMAAASLGAILAHHAVKVIYRRRRPEIALRGGKYEAAYPSGHTADATAVLATGAYLLVREELLPAMVVVPLAAALAASTGASRVALGWHWGSDVIGGWLTGLGVAAECARLYERLTTAQGERFTAEWAAGSAASRRRRPAAACRPTSSTARTAPASA
jgi:membrane-associated phospholipid phosphatase